jgi:hypothetical protein
MKPTPVSSSTDSRAPDCAVFARTNQNIHFEWSQGSLSISGIMGTKKFFKGVEVELSPHRFESVWDDDVTSPHLISHPGEHLFISPREMVEWIRFLLRNSWTINRKGGNLYRVQPKMTV